MDGKTWGKSFWKSQNTKLIHKEYGFFLFNGKDVKEEMFIIS